MKVYELLDSPEKWTKHFFARRLDGTPTDYDDPQAICWCLSGALMKCYGKFSTEYEEVAKKIHSCFKHPLFYWSLSVFNDDRKTKYEDVLAVLKEADV